MFKHSGHCTKLSRQYLANLLLPVSEVAQEGEGEGFYYTPMLCVWESTLQPLQLLFCPFQHPVTVATPYT